MEILDLENTHITENALQPLLCFEELKDLSLKSDFLSDVSLYAFSAISKLEKLRIRGAVLTDDGLLAFKPPVKLHLLDLMECWLLSKGALLSFSRHHPKIEVSHELLNDALRDKSVVAGSSSSCATMLKTLKPRRGVKPPQASWEKEKYTIQGDDLSLIFR